MDVHEWNIQPRSDHCAQCEKEFEDGEIFYTELHWESEGYRRCDCCCACRTARGSSSALSSWKSVYVVPPPPAEEPLKKETAESLLRQLIETDEEARGDIIFVLAVMLERKKIWVERDVLTDDSGMKTRFYEHRKTGEMFAVKDPELQLDELSHVQTKVLNLLDGRAETDEEQKASGEGCEETAETAVAEDDTPSEKNGAGTGHDSL